MSDLIVNEQLEKLRQRRAVLYDVITLRRPPDTSIEAGMADFLDVEEQIHSLKRGMKVRYACEW